MQPPCPTIDTITHADLIRELPESQLYQSAERQAASQTPWLLSPSPYVLTAEQVDVINRLGPALHRFTMAIERLYRNSLKDPALQWVNGVFNSGKPPHLMTFSQMKRFRSQLPLVIRPDLLVTDQGFTLCEIDAVPGGIGFTGALSKAYRALGFDLLGHPECMPKAFVDMLLAAYPQIEDNPSPFIAVVVSDESVDYRLELAWLVDAIQAFYPNIALLHPKDIQLMGKALGFEDVSGQFRKIEIIYRFFELFDLPNIPNIELIQYAVKKELVFCTPPFKPYLEEKLVLGLLHQPALEVFWLQELGEEQLNLLKSVVPETWILDPAEVPAFARITPDLSFAGKQLNDYTGLGKLTQKQRELVVKPSGFSPQAWGSRGVKVGHDLSQEDWQASVEFALAQFGKTPHILQRYENPKVEPYCYFHPQTHQPVAAEGRTRLCPYYFTEKDTVKLAGILATTCPKEKKVIHGMADGVLRPAIQQV